MKVVVNVRLKPAVLDPAGKAVQSALGSLGFAANSVRIGKQIVMEVSDGDKTAIKAQVEKMCEEILANPIIEEYEIVL